MKVSQYQIWSSVKDCVAGLKVTKIIKRFKFEGVWGKVETKSCFDRQSQTKYLKQSLNFMWNSAQLESSLFDQYWQNFPFGSKTGHLAIIPGSFEIFLYFLISLDTQP